MLCPSRQRCVCPLGTYCPVFPRSRCSNSSKTIVKETPSKNSKLFEAHSVAPASSAASVLRAQEQPSHKPSLYSPPTYPSSVFQSSNSTAQHQQENLPASNTQSEGKQKPNQTKTKPKISPPNLAINFSVCGKPTFSLPLCIWAPWGSGL